MDVGEPTNRNLHPVLERHRGLNYKTGLHIQALHLSSGLPIILKKSVPFLQLVKDYSLIFFHSFLCWFSKFQHTFIEYLLHINHMQCTLGEIRGWRSSNYY